MSEITALRRKPKIEKLNNGSYRVNLSWRESVDIGSIEINIWDLTLPAAKQAEYRARSFATVLPPRGFSDLSVDRDAKLSPTKMFALHNRLASVTSWFPIESDERPWKKIFASFQTIVLYRSTVPVGIAHFIKPQLGDDTIELKYIGLREDMIGKGLGRYFASHVLMQIAKRYPEQQITLSTTSFDQVNGKRALDFHKHMGFEEVGQATPCVTMDASAYYKIEKVAVRHQRRYEREFLHVKTSPAPDPHRPRYTRQLKRHGALKK